MLSLPNLLSGFTLVAVLSLGIDKAINLWKGYAERRANLARSRTEGVQQLKAAVDTRVAQIDGDIKTVELLQKLQEALTEAAARGVEANTANLRLQRQLDEATAALERALQQSDALQRKLDETTALLVETRAALDENKKELLALRALLTEKEQALAACRGAA